MSPRARTALWAGSLALGADLLSKKLVQAHFALNESVTILPGVFLSYVMNPGAAFSLFAGWPAALRLPFFGLVSLLALWAGRSAWRSLPEHDRLSALALGLMAGGALGNLVDRIRYGEVVDFIEVGVRGVYTWPVFNVADSAVCVGACLLIYRSFRPYASHPA